MKICVTGGSGFLGQHVVTALLDAGHDLQVLPGRKTLDLRWKSPALELSEEVEVLVHLAYPGTKGIQTSIETAADLVRDQLLIDLNVIDSAVHHMKVQKIITIGSVCEYPEHVTYPTFEESLWSGYPEAVNAPYGIAKRMQQGLLEAYRRQYGLQSTQLIMGNMYGPGDKSGHVIPSLIRRACQSAKSGEPLVVWGDGTATREFLYVEDAARAVVAAVEAPAQVEPINIVSGEEISIHDLTYNIVMGVGEGRWFNVRWDPTKPNGQPRRWFSNSRAKARLGWTPKMPFAQGLPETIAWLRAEETL